MAEPSADEVTARIKRAALRRFAAVGFGSATVDEIAAEAGVGVATLYRRWPDKAALGNDLLSDYLSDLESIYQPVEGGTAKRRFLAAWHQIWITMSAEPDRFVFGEANTHASFVSEEVYARKKQLVERSTEVLADLGIRANPLTAAAMILGTMMAILRDGLEVDPDDLGERLWIALKQA
ncbi:MAG: TetR/AcrR family transcriptional regulator [Actinomycetota bacterium]